MRPSGKIRKTISFVILGTSVMLWGLLLINPGNMLNVQHCPMTASGPSRASLQMLLLMNPVSSLLTGWTLMVVAMMFPKLILPIQYIYGRSIKRRRFWLASLFVLGYVTIWVAVGIFMIAAILGLNLLMPKSYIPAIVVGIITIIWQCSPVKQQCLNRSRGHITLSAFGWAANRDAIVFGVRHGLWCAGSGWALMLFPMLLPNGHNLAMACVTFVMTSEHLDHPQVPRWRLYFSGKLMRIIFAQTQIRLKRVLT